MPLNLLTYMQNNIDYLFMRRQHSKVVHRIFFEQDGSKGQNVLKSKQKEYRKRIQKKP